MMARPARGARLLRCDPARKMRRLDRYEARTRRSQRRSTMTFSISTVDGGIIRLSIDGELDVVTVPELRGALEKLLARRPDRVEVDLSSLRMIDSSGVGALVSFYKK